MVVLLPALFAVMFLGLQAALSYHARTIALAAATEGARAAAAEHGTTTAGTAAAASYLADTGGGALTGTTISARRTATAATVSVRGVALSVLPGWSPSVTQSATVPVERLT
jgi:Flp pilus assembly protein TadG